MIHSEPLQFPSQPRTAARLGGHPIILAAVTLAVVLTGTASIALWRSYTGASPELDRVVAARQLQTRTAQASEQLVEKTKGLEATQQESIDQLQVVQDQLQTVRRLLASQQSDTRKLSDQVTSLTESIDGLRQAFANAQPADMPSPPAARRRPARANSQATRSQATAAHAPHPKRAKTRG
jgi:uncharacterized protein HemX